MILGIGTDILDSSRLRSSLRNHRSKFMEKILTPQEIQEIEEREKPLRTFLDEERALHHLCLSVGKAFAAKEAFVKALGTGFRHGVRLQDIELQRNKLGRPLLKVSDHTRHVLDNLSPIGMHSEVHLSLSDESPYVTAYVIICAV